MEGTLGSLGDDAAYVLAKIYRDSEKELCTGRSGLALTRATAREHQ